MLRILKALVESVDLSIYSYVKPAAPHRFSTKFLDLHMYVRGFTDAIESYFNAIELGYSVAEGRLGLDNLGLGKLISNAISSSTKSLHLRGIHNLHLILIPVTISASYAYKLGSGSSSDIINKFNRGLKDILLYTQTNDVIAIYDALRSHESLIRVLMSRSSITRSKIESEGMNLYDFYSEIGRGDTVIKFFTDKYTSISSYALKYIKIYLEKGDHNKAVVTIFNDMAYDIFNIRIPELSDFVKLLRIDRDMVKKGIELSDLLPLLISSTFLANLMI